ncbi:MAG: hypothetical protein WCP28_14985 [Actinomycetes bacterium]
MTESLETDEKIYVGVVSYVDPSSTWIPEQNLFGPFTYKHLSFDYERELRAVIQRIPRVGGALIVHESVPSEVGIAIPINVTTLLESISVGPQQPSWFHEAVALTVEALAPSTTVLQSNLDTDPVH